MKSIKLKHAKHPRPAQARFQPNKGTYLVLREEEESVVNGIHIPDTAKERPQEGVVIASHPGNIYAVGDRPMFGRYAGTEIKIGDTVYLLLPEADVLGILVGA